MILEDFRDPRDNGPGLFAGVVGLLLGLLLGVVFIGKAEAPPASPQPETAAVTVRGNDKSPSYRAGVAIGQEDVAHLQAALDDAAAKASGGKLIAAAWPLDWTSPVLTKGGDEYMRMWSMSKPVVALAALEAATASGDPPSPEMTQAIDDAITRSDNCAIRRVALGLQVLRGGIEDAKNIFARVLAASGATPAMPDQSDADSACADYITAHQGDLPDPMADAALYGVTEWTIRDAIAFAHALGAGVYGREGKEVLKEMRKPKQLAETEAPEYQTFDPSFGIGNALDDWNPAYKSGWGGDNETDPSNHHYLVGQIAWIDDPPVALAAVFFPDTRPPDADPGKTAGPDELEKYFTAIKPALEQLKSGSDEPATGSK